MRQQLQFAALTFGIFLTLTSVGRADDKDLKLPTLPPEVKTPTLPPMISRFFFDVSGDGLNAFRNSSDNNQLVVPTAGPGTIISAHDLAYGHVAGYDGQLRVGYDPIGVEFRYLGGFQWTSPNFNAGAVGNVRIGSFSNFGATALTAGGHSTFDSREVNVRWKVFQWLTPFVGYRKLRMTDDTNFNIVFPAFNATYDYNIPWQAKGWQIGLDARLFGPGTPWERGPFFGDVDARIGWYKVTATTNFSLVPSTGGFFGGGSTFSQDNSRIYELGAAVGYQFWSNFEIRVGYRFIAVPDALFASDYVAASTALSSQNLAPNPRLLTIHMATIGARVMFGGNSP